MKKKYGEFFSVEKNEFFLYCKNKKRLIAFCTIISLLMVAALYKASCARESALVFSGERIVGIRGDGAVDGITLHMVAEQEDVSIERNVTLMKPRSANEEETDVALTDPESELDIEITRMIRNINSGMEDSKEVNLPESLGDNTYISWQKAEAKGSWVLPLLFPPMVIIFLYRGKKDELKRAERSEVAEIMMELPSFNNKLVLLLGSGLVYEESIKRIANRGNSQGSRFLIKTLGEFITEAEQTNGDATRMLKDFAGKRKIGELKRITSIIMDNRKKGTDLRSKLSLEGELLWERRKKKAEEMARLAESKLTLPLGIMMVPILIVTAGPALMQM